MWILKIDQRLCEIKILKDAMEKSFFMIRFIQDKILQQQKNTNIIEEYTNKNITDEATHLKLRSYTIHKAPIEHLKKRK